MNPPVDAASLRPPAARSATLWRRRRQDMNYESSLVLLVGFVLNQVAGVESQSFCKILQGPSRLRGQFDHLLSMILSYLGLLKQVYAEIL